MSDELGVELDKIKLQIRADGKMIRAHLKIEGKPTIFVADMNAQVAQLHPELYEMFKAFCKECLSSMVGAALGDADAVVGTREKPPAYDH